MDDGKWVCQLAAEATSYLSTYNHALEEKARAELLMYKSHRKMNFGHLSSRKFPPLRISCISALGWFSSSVSTKRWWRNSCRKCCLQHDTTMPLKERYPKDYSKSLLKTSPCIAAGRPTEVFCRQGVAVGVGLCANSHLEGTLAKLEEFGKSDAFKKSPSIFNLLKVQRYPGFFPTHGFLTPTFCPPGAQWRGGRKGEEHADPVLRPSGSERTSRKDPEPHRSGHPS